jgi:hypothetical protein
MTNTTRELTFYSDDRSTLLKVSTSVPNGKALKVSPAGYDGTWVFLAGEQVEELHELTGLVLAGRKLEYGDNGVQDARMVCGARHGERLVCILNEDHAWPTALGPHGHVSADGTTFLVNPDADDLPF